MTVLARWLLRWLFLPAPTHVRAATGREGRGYVDTLCGRRVHHTRAAAPHGAVSVELVPGRPRRALPEWARVPVEHWVTCPDCRGHAGWPTVQTTRRRVPT